MESNSNDEHSENDYVYSDDDMGDYKIEDKCITAAFQRMCLEIDNFVELLTGCGFGQRIHYSIASSFFEMDKDRLTALNINGHVSIWLQYEPHLDEIKVLKVNCLVKRDDDREHSHVVKWLETRLCKFVKALDEPILSRKRKLQEKSTNILKTILDGVKDIVLNCHKYCLVCSNAIENVGVYPTVCAAEFCNFCYEEIGVGLPLEHFIEHNTLVFDLLVTLFIASVDNACAELFYPSRIHVNEKSFVLHDGSPDWLSLRQAVNSIPPIDEMLRNVSSLRIFLDGIDILVYPLLRWIVATNRSHLRFIPPEVHKLEDVCSHLFVLVTAPYKKELAFQKMKQIAAEAATSTTGSILAFHGSPCGNWHSILRMGIKNFSNTKYMSSGASYGAGAYFSENISTSMNYSKAFSFTRLNSSLVKNGSINCLAICELAANPADVNSRQLPQGMHVIQDEDRIMTRFLLVNPTTSNSDPCLMASSLSHKLSDLL